jgi:hypothetical protein
MIQIPDLSSALSTSPTGLSFLPSSQMTSNPYAKVSARCPAVNYYYSSGSHVPGMRQIGHDQVDETQSNSSRLEVAGTNLQICDHGRRANLLNMPVLRAQNLPRLKTLGKFYATVTDSARTWQTRSVQSVGNRAEWNENLDTLWVIPYFDSVYD